MQSAVPQVPLGSSHYLSSTTVPAIRYCLGMFHSFLCLPSQKPACRSQEGGNESLWLHGMMNGGQITKLIGKVSLIQ